MSVGLTTLCVLASVQFRPEMLSVLLLGAIETLLLFEIVVPTGALMAILFWVNLVMLQSMDLY